MNSFRLVIQTLIKTIVLAAFSSAISWKPSSSWYFNKNGFKEHLIMTNQTKSQCSFIGAVFAVCETMVFHRDWKQEAPQGFLHN